MQEGGMQGGRGGGLRDEERKPAGSIRGWEGGCAVQCNIMQCLFRTLLLPLPPPKLPPPMASGLVGGAERMSCCGGFLFFRKTWPLIHPGTLGVKSVRASPAGLGTAGSPWGIPLMTQDADVICVGGGDMHPSTTKKKKKKTKNP